MIAIFVVGKPLPDKLAIREYLGKLVTAELFYGIINEWDIIIEFFTHNESFPTFKHPGAELQLSDLISLSSITPQFTFEDGKFLTPATQDMNLLRTSLIPEIIIRLVGAHDSTLLSQIYSTKKIFRLSDVQVQINNDSNLTDKQRETVTEQLNTYAEHVLILRQRKMSVLTSLGADIILNQNTDLLDSTRAKSLHQNIYDRIQNFPAHLNKNLTFSLGNNKNMMLDRITNKSTST